MEVYRITLSQFADRLFAPGKSGRWNKEGELVIYAAASRSLACLENLVHRRGRAQQAHYRVMVIHIPDTLAVARVELDQLPNDWQINPDVHQCQQLGSQWYQRVQSPGGSSPVLSVPSAVVPMERNLVIHAEHPDFTKIQLIDTEPFRFDPRLVALRSEK